MRMAKVDSVFKSIFFIFDLPLGTKYKRSSVSQQMFHNKDPSLLKCHSIEYNAFYRKLFRIKILIFKVYNVPEKIHKTNHFFLLQGLSIGNFVENVQLSKPFYKIFHKSMSCSAGTWILCTLNRISTKSFRHWSCLDIILKLEQLERERR